MHVLHEAIAGDDEANTLPKRPYLETWAHPEA
jgi:hypothetical protein